MSVGPRKVSAHGKCILAGEHAVVRGGEALVLPLQARHLEIRWEPLASEGLEIESGPFADAVRASLGLALRRTGFRLPEPGYALRIASDIPVQAGLGSSAALAVAVVRFLKAEGASIEDPFKLSLEIEDLFHGKSSGIDVACALASAPVSYRKGEPPRGLLMAWKPLLYLSDTGRRSRTKDCVRVVVEAARADLDRRMEEAVGAAKAALVSEENGHPFPRGRLGQLAAALELAASCFEEWGLGPDPEAPRKLREAGALAVKPTGSGGGGFLLSLWEHKPPAGLGLIPVWEGSSAAP